MWDRAMAAMASNGIEGVRAYLRTLRQERGISHQRLAKAIGYNKRSLIGWESGTTKKNGTNELRQTVFVRAVIELGGSWDHIVDLVEHNADAARGEALAHERLSPKGEEVIAPHLADDEGLGALLEAVDSYRADQRKMGEVIGFAKSLHVAGHELRTLGVRYTRRFRRKHSV